MQHKLWFDEERLGFLGQRKQTKIQSNVAILNNVKREKLVDVSGTKRRYIWKLKLINSKLAVR
jgi:hypothetical protein